MLFDTAPDVLVRVAVCSNERVVAVNRAGAQAAGRVLGRGVEGDAVCRLRVPVLVDIKLAQVVVAVHPERGPGTASWLREVREVAHKQTIVVL